MQHIFLDFEMNPIPKKNKEARTIVRSEICEIGAVKLNEAYEIIDTFSCYVRPQLNQIMLNITQLTGITNQDVERAKELSSALDDFVFWIGDGPVRIYSWSDTDKTQLVNECLLKKIMLPKQFRRWMDFQRVYSRLMGLSRRSCLSLSNALGSVEQDFSGSQHSALADAKNSASLLALVKDKESFQKRAEKVQSFLGVAKNQGTTLGDLLADTFAKLKSETL